MLHALPDEIQDITRTVFSSDQLDAIAGKDGMERLKKWFFQRVKQAYETQSQYRQQAIDNPASYRALSAQCDGEISRRVGGN